MPAVLVTTTQAVAHLRVDGLDDAPDIALKLAAAEQVVLEFLDRKVYATQQDLDAAVAAGTAGEKPMLVTDLVRSAILLTLSDLYVNRGDAGKGSGLPPAAANLLRTTRIAGA